MTDIIGKTIDEIIDRQPDLDDLSWREVCYIVALGMGDIVYRYDESFEFQDMTSTTAGNKSASWPDYTSSGEHAMRLLAAFPRYTMCGRRASERANVAVGDYKWEEVVYGQNSRPKLSITRAAAKCVLNGIESEVSE